MSKSIREIIREELAKLELRTVTTPREKAPATNRRGRASNPSANALMCEMGRALYGDMWQSRLCAALGVSKMTAHKWAHNDASPSYVYIQNAAKLLRERRAVIDELLSRLV